LFKDSETSSSFLPSIKKLKKPMRKEGATEKAERKKKKANFWIVGLSMLQAIPMLIAVCLLSPVRSQKPIPASLINSIVSGASS